MADAAENTVLVESAGARTTIQDLGRVGFAHVGVPRSGAADWFSARLANALVGNVPSAPLLEATLIGPRLRFRRAALVAVTGAPAPVTVDGAAVPPFQPVAIPAGGVLQIGTMRSGVRAYVAVRGGVAAPLILGSASTDTLSGLGPPPLTAGAELPLGNADQCPAPPADDEVRELAKNAAAGVLLAASEGQVRFLPTVEGDPAELAGEYRVRPESDRVGVRLAPIGKPPAATRPAETMGMVGGAIQLPPDGNPIILLADHAVTGGYPVAGVVIYADLPLVAQARPGDRVRLVAASEEEAHAALVARHLVLARVER
ncbi:MAG: biotin-dependent carboxyltransferase family protein [Acidothermus cellulolyticus]|nr:biotin-dependent carboxyltransferase family protein [Acidothermus cellulolyticus]